MFTVLLFLCFLPAAVFGHRQPGCPNDQEPKRNPDGSLVQCLPGAAQKAICGASHTCFFSGMNYMCCPSNEPSAENQPTCPKSTMTVIDSHGLPLKCSPRTRQCPQASMFCTDVGMAFICCEKPPMQEENQETLSSTKKVVKKVKKTRRIKVTTTTPPPEETNECPEGSIGVLNHYGEPLKCSSQAKCSGFGRFCQGGPGGPICCEKIEFAKNILDNPPSQAATFVEQKAPFRAQSVSVAMKPAMKPVEGSVGTNRKIALPVGSGEREFRRKQKLFSVPLSPVPRRNIVDDSARTLPTLPVETTSRSTTTTSTTTTTEAPTTETEPLIIFTTTTEVPTTKPRAFAAVRVSELERGDSRIPLQETSRGRASDLLNAQEKRTMAQKFLMHQIRNGWPYDDRFYRPDVDAFTNEQRNDIARLRFIDN